MVSAAGEDELAIGNVQGDTALHLAAKSGSTFFCRCIAEKDVTLVGKQNESGETPLFSAVSRGHTQAFLYLHHLCKEKAPHIRDKPETYTRNHGDTILHSAIFEERYDLAYIIILKYPKLVQQPNSDGLLPLHLLATKSEAFPSGLHLSRIHKLIYPCVCIGDLAKKLDLDKAPNPQLGWDTDETLLDKGLYLSLSIIFWFKKVTETREDVDHASDKTQDGGAANIQDHGEINQKDEEAANVKDDPTMKSWIRRSSKKIMLGCRYLLILPLAIVLLICLLCIILGLCCGSLVEISIRIAIMLVKEFSGYNEYVRVKHMKETCVWSEKVMNKLIKSYKKSPAQEHQSLDQLGISPAQEHQSLESTIKETCVWSVKVMNNLIESYEESPAQEHQSLDQLGISPAQEHQSLESTIKHMKETCVWLVKVMNNLIESCEKSLGQLGISPAQEHRSLDSTIKPGSSKEDEKSAEAKIKPGSSKEDEKSAEAKIKIVEKPMFDAAKHGISEMVLRILVGKPEEIFEVNAEKKNIVMLAVEHRHNHLYNALMNYGRINKTVLEQVDKDGNNLLHIAANLEKGKQCWRIRGAALHMHMEIKWYEYVKKSMPSHLVQGRNKKKQTPKEILQYSHKDLIKEGHQWLTDTSQSCSLVAALIATVSFAASATVPGGLKQDTGVPSLENKPIFIASAISALVALCSSMISVVMFLSILTSSFKLQDFRRDLPFKLLWGLVSLLISIFSMIISFFAGHYFVLKQEFNHQAALVYEIVCSTMVALILYTFPLEFEIVWSTIRTRPTK